jgi:hypothetical protein
MTTTTSHKVYVCYVRTGQYSDTEFENKIVFSNEDKAKAFVEEFNKVTELNELDWDRAPTNMTWNDRQTLIANSQREATRLIGELIKKYKLNKILAYEDLYAGYNEFEVIQ